MTTRLPICLFLCASTAMAAPQTFCNPLNLDYGWRDRTHCHGADPVVVLFKDRYYLFSTWDVAGFRVSDDLQHWTSHTFPAPLAPLMTSDNSLYCAPAVAAQGDWLYFINMTPRNNQRSAPVMRTRDPISGAWEQCGQIKKVSDPALFFDDDGRAWLYHGLRNPTKVFELDSRTWTEIPGSEVQLRTATTNLADFVGGYERGRREIFAETDTGAFLDKFQTLPCQEAAWMTKHNGRYYLQYATPGTVCQWYCDVALEGPSPTGPFKLADYSPVSFKVGGFIGSAGHSCVFQDRKAQWWRVTTMWIGVHEVFERRIGLFPVHFDAKGRMSTDTVLGDYPRKMADGSSAGWMVQSFGRNCAASSALTNHPPALASDENIRTWWSAESGGTNEWFQMDLGQPRRVHAIQVNFAEQDAKIAPDDDHHAYRLLASEDGTAWKVLVDKSASRACTPHDYVELAKPAAFRHLKLENVHTPCGGRFAIRDLRVFGHGGGKPPAPVTGLTIERHSDDDRNVTVRWNHVADAQGYLLRFGTVPDALYQCLQVQGGNTRQLTMHALTRGLSYAWRLDSFNENGVTPGQPVLEPSMRPAVPDLPKPPAEARTGTRPDLNSFRTPYKLNRYILTKSDNPKDFDSGYATCPFVFSSNKRFYMTYVGHDGIGYQTGLAESDDLVNWQKLGMIIGRDPASRFRRYSIGLTSILRENGLSSPGVLKKVNGRYVGSWLAFPEQGHEAGPAVIGLAWSDDLKHWELTDPVLRPEDGAEWERGGLYKSYLLEADGSYYLFYNAKNKTAGGWREQTGVATSRDLKSWTRRAGNPVIPNGPPDSFDEKFASDPVVLRVGSNWALFYFGLASDNHARELLAVSSDLVHFHKVNEVVVDVGPVGSIDDRHAHKPSIITWRGDLYHFYDAVSNKVPGGPTKAIRGISVARSRPW